MARDFHPPLCLLQPAVRPRPCQGVSTSPGRGGKHAGSWRALGLEDSVDGKERCDLKISEGLSYALFSPDALAPASVAEASDP